MSKLIVIALLVLGVVLALLALGCHGAAAVPAPADSASVAVPAVDVRVPPSAFHVADQTVSGDRVVDPNGFVTVPFGFGATLYAPLPHITGGRITAVRVLYAPDGGGQVLPRLRRLELATSIPNSVWTGVPDAIGGPDDVKQQSAALMHNVAPGDAYEVIFEVSGPTNRIHGAIVTVQ